MSTLICIVGPTCAGKTDIGILLAEKLNGEIISADSRQIYKYLDIGTAKPTIEQRKQVNHHLIDIIEPDKVYNAVLYSSSADKIILSLLEQGKQPIVVGGSGFYIKALVDGLFEAPSSDESLRLKLENIAKEKGNLYLHNELNKIDPESAKKIHPNNVVRIIRAIEVYELTGYPISLLQKKHKESKKGSNSKFLISNGKELELSVVCIGLTYPRRILYDRINTRVDKMIEMGLIDEVERILGIYKSDSPGLQTVGYKEIIDYLQGKYNKDTAIELIKRNTRRYAKRQLTWFNSDKRIKWIEANNDDKIESIFDRVYGSVKTGIEYGLVELTD